MQLNLFPFTRHKTITKYLLSSFLSLPVSLFTGFLTFKIIDPYFLGVWTTIAVFESYLIFLRLGIVNGMNRELPFALGSGKKDEATAYAQTTLAFTVLNILMVIVLTPIILTQFELNAIYLSVITVFFIRIVLSFYTTYLTGTFRSDDNFNKLSDIQFIMLLLRLFLSPLILVGFNGYLIMELILIIVNAGLLHYYRPFRIKPKFHSTAFKNLLKIGLPLFITSTLIGVIDTFPRLYIIKFGDERLMGLYAPVLMLISTVAMLPNILSTYMYPKFSFQFGKTNDVNNMWQQLKKIYLLSFVFILVIILVSFFLLEYFVYFFPKYADSLPYLKLSLLICPFVMYKIGTMLFAVLKDYKYLIFYVIIYAGIQIMSLLLFSLKISDVLDIVIYSQVLTTACLFLVSLMMNYYIIFIRQITPATVKS